MTDGEQHSQLERAWAWEEGILDGSEESPLSLLSPLRGFVSGRGPHQALDQETSERQTMEELGRCRLPSRGRREEQAARCTVRRQTS